MFYLIVRSDAYGIDCHGPYDSVQEASDAIKRIDSAASDNIERWYSIKNEVNYRQWKEENAIV